MKLSYFFAVVASVASAISVQAQSTNAPINTVPEGITTFNLAATGAGVNSTSYFSAPLQNDPVYTGAVASLSTVGTHGVDTVTVGDSPAPWTAGQFANAAAPYFLKFLSGAQSGRTLLITANTTSGVTLDLSDNTAQYTALNASSFTVVAGDTFEIFAGDTLGLMFGLNTTQSPLVLKPGSTITADSVTIFSPLQNQLLSYYFSSSLNYWVQIGVTGNVNANNTIIRPYAAFFITRRASEAATSFVLTGRVAEVDHKVKVLGTNATSYDSTGYPVDVKLSELQLANWAKAPIPQTGQPSSIFADTISVWDALANHFDSYFQCTDNTWRKVGGDGSNQSNFVIPAATTVCFVKRTSASGATSYLEPLLPYSLTN